MTVSNLVEILNQFPSTAEVETTGGKRGPITHAILVYRGGASDLSPLVILSRSIGVNVGNKLDK